MAKKPKAKVSLDDDQPSVEQVLEVCFGQHAYEKAIALACDLEDAREAVRILGYAWLALGNVERAREEYESLAERYAFLPGDLLAAARGDLERAPFPAAAELRALLAPPTYDHKAIDAFWKALPDDLRTVIARNLRGELPDGKVAGPYLAAAYHRGHLSVDQPVASLAPLAAMPRLRSLTINTPVKLAELAAFRLTKLRFDIELDDFTNVDFLRDMHDLERLILFGNDHVTDLSGIADASRLEFLQLGYGEVRDLAFLHDKPKLEFLFLTVADDLAELPVVGKLTTLETLELFSNGLRSFDALAPLAHLDRLEVKARPYTTSQLRTLDGLAGKPKLRALDIDGAAELVDISALAQVPSLRRLIVRDAEKLADFTPIAALTELEHLELEKAGKLVDLRQLGPKPKLETLRIGWTGVEDLSPLAAYRALHELVCYRTGKQLRGSAKLLGIENLELEPSEFVAAERKALTKRFRSSGE